MEKSQGLIEWLIMTLVVAAVTILVSEAMAATYTVSMRDGKVVEFQDQTSTARFVLRNEEKVQKIIEHHEVVLTEKLRFKKLSVKAAGAR